ncbi:hypothetical protein JYT96_01365 [Gammaproteobacteria bacterium AH-315-C21]|nr:hypothetical protein [Gammaproteobacteria bacterium AH-315-C21]
MDDLDDDSTGGQIADYLAAEQSGDNGAWNMGIVEYLCPKCKVVVQIMNDELTSYNPLIIAWHDKAADGDWFARFVFEYLSFVSHIKNNLYISENSDRDAIQALKQDERIAHNYLERIEGDADLSNAWNEVIEELNEKPLHNSSRDPDDPKIDGWWNSMEGQMNKESTEPKGRVLSLEDWSNMVEFWCCVRNNLFHGGKNPNMKRDMFLVEHAFITLRSLMDDEISSLKS